jgi:muramoyltetrapeptide carboxypeptidase
LEFEKKLVKIDAMISPQILQKGDKIGIIATARKISIEELSASISLLQNWGFEVVFSPNLFKIENQFAGSSADRTADLQWAVNHPELKAVIVARGGYGTSKMIDGVDFSDLKKHPKWFIGFSDITVLHSHLHRLGFHSIHGPLALTLSREGQEENALRLYRLLFDNQIDMITCSNHSLNRNGKAKGQLIGGNLSILHTILGTDSDVNYDGKILFIEDLDEYLYHIDRMMVHLERAGKFKKLAGIIVGSMSDMRDNAIPFGKNVEEIIADVCSNYDFPLAFNFPIGHEKTNFPLIVGEEVELEVTKKESSLVFLNRKRKEKMA